MTKMTENTKKAIKNARDLFGMNEFTAEEWNKANTGVTLRTAINHGAVVVNKHIIREYYTVTELVEMLNACAGTDCYDVEYNLKVDETGRAYEDCEYVTYNMA